jgi:hypothetical protein
MVDVAKISESEAIRQIIAEGGVMDYVDVVEAVRKKFGIRVSSALVEKVHSQLQQEARNQTPSVQPRIRLELGQPPKEPLPAPERSGDHLAQVLRFVKSVHGLQNAKRALAELEAVLLELND